MLCKCVCVVFGVNIFIYMLTIIYIWQGNRINMNRSWVQLSRWHSDHINGCIEFLRYLEYQENVSGILYHKCPCKNCQCRTSAVHRTREGIGEHLSLFGFWEFYMNWTEHGEAQTTFYPSLFNRDDVGPSNHSGCVDGDMNSTTTLLNDVFPYGRHVAIDDNVVDDDINEIVENIDQTEVKKYNRLLARHQTPLYDGSNSTVLGTIMELMEAKVKFKTSIAAFDKNLDIMKRKLPEPNNLPKNHDKVRRILRDLGLGYVKIHACRYDCAIFYGEYKGRDTCPKCETPRYKVTGSGKNVPVKVLYYFPVRYRLQRMFMSAHTAKDMRWHKERIISNDDILRHPSDGEAWKQFNEEFPDFASDARNVRLGLSTDGFNPFASMTLSHSTWPVMLWPYNLPPWMCMKKEYNFLTLLIPGPKSPGRCLDVYLKPLIDELNFLWAEGIRTFDKHSQTFFTMRAALIWTISDFPGYGMLSAHSTQGYKSCPL